MASVYLATIMRDKKMKSARSRAGAAFLMTLGEVMGALGIWGNHQEH